MRHVRNKMLGNLNQLLLDETNEMGKQDVSGVYSCPTNDSIQMLSFTCKSIIRQVHFVMTYATMCCEPTVIGLG